MKKNLMIVAALAGMSASAFAQSTVTLYGRMNTTLEFQKDGNADRVTAINNNSSRWGIRGSEDLGGGLKANFTLESGLNSDTGGSATPFFGRQSSVELSSASMGAVRLGNWLPGSYFATADYVSNHNHDTGRSSDALFSGVSFLVRQNKIGYFTPNMGGFNAEIAYNLHENPLGGSNGLDLSANYGAGPLALGAGYTKVGGQKQFAARAYYTMGALGFGGYFQRETIDGSANGSSRNIVRLSGMYTMGASEFHANVGSSQKGGAMDNSARQYTIGYNHNLSKRTKVYGYFTKVSSDAVALPKSDSFAVGVRHNF